MQRVRQNEIQLIFDSNKSSFTRISDTEGIKSSYLDYFITRKLNSSEFKINERYDGSDHLPISTSVSIPEPFKLIYRKYESINFKEIRNLNQEVYKQITNLFDCLKNKLDLLEISHNFLKKNLKVKNILPKN